MPIELFEMERMQSTWENLVEFDMSESGVRPVTLRELAEMGLDIESVLDMPLGYSQSNGTLGLRRTYFAECLAVHLITANCALAEAFVTALYSEEEMHRLKQMDSETAAPLLADKMKSI